MVDIREYELLALETGIYREIEFTLLREALMAWKEKPSAPYELVELRDGRLLAGFCLFYRSPETDYTYDIHSFLVGPGYTGSAVGPQLLRLVELSVAAASPLASPLASPEAASSGVLRIETSRQKEEAVGPKFFAERGFQVIGHIPDFYRADNDYYIYVKSVGGSQP